MFPGGNFGVNMAPPVIHPTTNYVNHTFSKTVVPHIHPVHTTTVNHHMFEHKHYCPHTSSCCEDVCNQHVNCCNPCAPGGGMPTTGFGMGGAGFGPGFGAGPFMGPRP
nr:CotD family spore coat protein [Bacillus rubiinfantis]